MDSTTTGKYAAKRVAEHIGYDGDIAYQLYLWTPNGSTRIDDDEIMVNYNNFSVARLRAEEF